MSKFVHSNNREDEQSQKIFIWKDQQIDEWLASMTMPERHISNN